jgi:hypothetical protein
MWVIFHLHPYVNYGSLYRLSRNNQLLTDTEGGLQVQLKPNRPRTVQVRLEIRRRRERKYGSSRR